MVTILQFLFFITYELTIKVSEYILKLVVILN